MALFKSRKKKVDEPVAAASPAESIEVMRRRARHRLIGAVVLVLAGVIGFPLLFDTQPRPVAVDIPIEIPDRNCGGASGLTLLRSGISMGMSTATGRGCVSNSRGKPMTPASTSTTAPIRRWRARRRMTSTLSAGEDAATGSSTFFLRNLNKARG